METVCSDVYYNPLLMGKRDFSNLERDFSVTFIERQKQNTELFRKFVRHMFMTCRSRSVAQYYRWNSTLFPRYEKKMRSLYDDYLERIQTLYTDNPSQIVEHSISWLLNTLQSLYDAYKSVPPVPTIVERGGKKVRVKSDLSPVAVKDGKQISYSVQDFYFFVEFVVIDTFAKDTSPLFNSCLSKPEPILYNLEGEEYDDQYKRLISKKDVLVERSSKEKIVPQYNREATLSLFKQEMDTYLWVQKHLDEYQEYDYATENKAEDCIKRMYEDYVRRV